MEKIIMERLGCSAKEAAEIAADLADLHTALKPVLSAWINGEPYNAESEYEGYSIKTLMQDYGMQFTGAILTVDWLLKDPKEAAKALAYGIR